MKKFIFLLLFIPSFAIGNAEVISPNMGLPVPTVGITTGPAYAYDINNSLGIIDSHDHSVGHGVPITPAGINLSSDLSFISHNATSVRTVRFTPQGSPITGAAPDLGAVYVSGVDLYYNDVSGNQVRLTQSGGVAGSPGSISNLNSPASAAFVAASGTFVWSQGSSIAGNMDAATYILRYPSAGYPSPTGNYIALQAPSSLATGYALTLPSAQAGTLGQFMTADTSGNLNWTRVDGTTLNYASAIVKVANSGINTTQIADGAVTKAKLAPTGLQSSTSTGVFATSSTSFVDITNATVTITTTGRPVVIGLSIDGTGSIGAIGLTNSTGSANTVTGSIELLRGASNLGIFSFGSYLPNIGTSTLSPAIIYKIDQVAAGTYTYKLQGKIDNGSNTLNVNNAQLVVYELD